MQSSLASVKHWVVRCPNWVGDIVMATPVFESLRSNFPDATISVLIRPYARGIVEHNPCIDHIIDCDDKSWRGLQHIRQQVRGQQGQSKNRGKHEGQRQDKYQDLNQDQRQDQRQDQIPTSIHNKQPTTAGLLLTNTTHSFLSLKYAGVPKVYGYRRNLRRFFLSGGPEPVRLGNGYQPMPMQDYYLALCSHLGMILPSNPRPTLYIDDDLQQRGQQHLARLGIKEGDRLIGLNPGASFGSSKCWPAENFARLAELLQASYGCKVILLVGPGEEAIARRIVAESKADIINTADDLLDLALLKPIIKRCNLLITNDTGPRHFAVAFNVPTVVLMGPTNPLYTASHLQQTSVIRRDLACSPCHKKICPLGHHACMREITPAMVMEHSSQYLAGPIV